MAAAAMAIAEALETQTRLTVIAGVSVGQAGLEADLAGGVLAQAGLDDVAEDEFVDLVGGDAGAVQRLLDGDCAELLRRGAGEAALKAALGRP